MCMFVCLPAQPVCRTSEFHQTQFSIQSRVCNPLYTAEGLQLVQVIHCTEELSTKNNFEEFYLFKIFEAFNCAWKYLNMPYIIQHIFFY